MVGAAAVVLVAEAAFINLELLVGGGEDTPGQVFLDLLNTKWLEVVTALLVREGSLLVVAVPSELTEGDRRKLLLLGLGPAAAARALFSELSVC